MFHQEKRVQCLRSNLVCEACESERGFSDDVLAGTMPHCTCQGHVLGVEEMGLGRPVCIHIDIIPALQKHLHGRLQAPSPFYALDKTL